MILAKFYNSKGNAHQTAKCPRMVDKHHHRGDAEGGPSGVHAGVLTTQLDSRRRSRSRDGTSLASIIASQKEVTADASAQPRTMP